MRYTARMHPTFLALLLAACSTDKAAPPATDDSAAGGEEAAAPVDTAAYLDEAEDTDTGPPEDTAPQDPHVEEEQIGPMEDIDAWIFASDTVHQVDLSLSDAAWAALTADPETYVEADVLFDGMPIPSSAVRIKGQYGSFRTLTGKPSLKIDFNRYVDDQRFFGLEKITLNNAVVDCAYMKERVSYRVFEQMGIPAARTGHAWVTMNGHDYGLYNLIESVDDRFLTRVHGDDSGNLYDGAYYLYEWTWYVLLDFNDFAQDFYALNEGVDVDHMDIHRITDGLAAFRGKEDFYANMGALVDWDEVLRFAATEELVGQNDGYGLNTNNYFVFFNPRTGLMEMYPWDLDYSMLYDWQWGRNWASPAGVLLKACNEDDTCREAWKAAVVDVLNTLDKSDLKSYYESVAEASWPYAMTDPRRECSLAAVGNMRADIQTWFIRHPDEVKARWGIE